MDLSLVVFFIAGMEWVWLIVAAVVVILGVKKIPELARTFGRSKAEFLKGQIEGEHEVKKMLDDENPQKENKKTD